MPDVQIHVDVEDRGVDEMFANLARTLSPASFTQFLRTEAEPLLHARAAERFANEGGAGVPPWEQLAPSTAYRFRIPFGYGGFHPINVRTGALRSFLVSEPALILADPDGAVMQFPGPAPSPDTEAAFEHAQLGNLGPPRPVLAFDPTDQAAIAALFVNWFMASVSQGFTLV